MKVTGIEVFPCVEDEGCVVRQMEGSDGSTSFWTVYHRYEDRTAHAAGDYADFAIAHSVALADSVAYGVPITVEVE